MTKRFGISLLVLVIAQSLFLGAMIWDRATLLSSENLVTLKTRPIDPRDIFRGDYVILNYEINFLEIGKIGGDTDFSSGDKIYVELAPEDETWTAIAAWRASPSEPGNNKIIRGRVGYISAERSIQSAPDSETAEDTNSALRDVPCPTCSTVNVTYGIESYFVPEGEGRELEKERNAGALTIDVALGKDGTAAIRRLRINGEPVYQETLF